MLLELINRYASQKYDVIGNFKHYYIRIDLQPIENYSEWRLTYFISFILLVGFFVLNMFVGVVVENFHRCREEQEKEERVRRAAKRALQMEKKRRRKTLLDFLT